MKIVFVLPSFHTNLYGALRALLAAGAEVTLIVRRAGLGKLEGVKEVFLGKTISWPGAWEILRREKPDLVVIRRTPGLSRRIMLCALMQRRKVVQYDQQPFLQPDGVQSWLRRLTAPFRLRRFTPVPGLRGEGSRPDPAAIYLPFPFEALPAHRSRSYAPDGRLRILCVGKLGQPRKNHFVVLKALEELADRFDFVATFIGVTGQAKGFDRDYLARMLDYPANGRIGDRVKVIEGIPFEEMRRLYMEHDLCILPSHDEPFGAAPLEAIAMGSAAIISDECGSAGYLEAAAQAGFECGYIVQAGDSAALRDRLEPILANRDLAQSLGRSALDWARKELTEDLFAKRFLRMAAK